MFRLALAAALAATLAPAAVRRVEITGRAAASHGYERITGRVTFGLAPKSAANRIVRDLQFAPVNATGEVECSADLYMLAPADPAKSNGTVLFEVSNRGGMGMLNRFNFARGSNDAGDGWLFEQGYTLVWLGWEWDIPASAKNSLHFTAPHFRPDALPAAGMVRSEFVTDKPVQSMGLADRTQEPIPVGKAVALYVRAAAGEVPRRIPREEWSLAADGRSVAMPAGFEIGKLYEFVYHGKDPVVAGTGLAAVRDWISYLKYGGVESDVSRLLAVKRAIGFGISQSGRFLRQFLYEGFNADEQGRKVFDGVWADVAGAGRGSFNFRYAQPSRDGCPFLNIFYPTDLFPFTDAAERDPLTDRADSLLGRARSAKVVPRLFLTNNSYEYWGRAAALIHVTADGLKDVPLSPETRYYFTAGVQHFPRSLPLVKSGTEYLVNPVDHRPVQRALLAALQAWVKEGTEPPASVYPRISEGQLTALEKLRFPAVPGVAVPKRPRLARRLDFGNDFATLGIVSKEPPTVTGVFPLLVPQVDEDGIDLGGIRLPELAVPVATITGWNLRAPARGAPEEMTEFYGSIFPFARTAADRQSGGDPRRSVGERYTGREQYMERVRAAAARLVEMRFVLPRDREFVEARAASLWDALAGR
jgi:hypothetical protein